MKARSFRGRENGKYLGCDVHETRFQPPPWLVLLSFLAKEKLRVAWTGTVLGLMALNVALLAAPCLHKYVQVQQTLIALGPVR